MLLASCFALVKTNPPLAIVSCHPYNPIMTIKCLPTWREMNMDTSPEAEAVLIEGYRRMTLKQKFEQVERLNRMGRALAMSGLRRRYPEASEEQIRRRLAGLLLGEELATKAYGTLEC